MEQKKRVGIWVRVSTEFQVKDDSPEHHEQRARYYAEAKGWEVIEVYRLEAISGKTVMELPETKKMLRDIHTGRITALVFSKLARLARNTKELLEFSELFRNSNADMISLAENIDTSSPPGGRIRPHPGKNGQALGRSGILWIQMGRQGIGH